MEKGFPNLLHFLFPLLMSFSLFMLQSVSAYGQTVIQVNIVLISETKCICIEDAHILGKQYYREETMHVLKVF